MAEATGVVGGGTMGAGIAQVLLVAGAAVTVVESDTGRVGAVRDGLLAQLRRAVERGHAPDDPARLARLSVTDDLDALRSAELVVEAVPEVLDLKLDLLPRVEAVLDATALLATNTSSMSVSRLAGPLRRPERFCGMHFFNPVPRSQLVELVTHERLDDAALDRARGWVDRLGKTAITVRDAPGFASSRLGLALGMEAIRMVEEGVATAEDIDRAMELGYRHPMGPLRLTDLVGLDVRLAIAEYLGGELGERFTPPQLLREMVAQGRLGQKSGEGFYRW